MVDVNGKLLACNSIEELTQFRNSLKNDIPNDESNSIQKPAYTKKLESEQLQSIFNLIELKQNQLGRFKFKFVGDPQPPTHFNYNTKSSEKEVGVSATNCNSIILDGKLVELNSDYSYIESCRRSVLNLNTKSLHLQEAIDSIVKVVSNGPILIQKMSNCIIVLSCHQARFHNVSDSVVIVVNNDNEKRPLMIENCRNLITNDIRIEDFNHPLKDFKDPGFTVLNEEQTIKIIQMVDECNLENLKTMLSLYIKKEEEGESRS
ncbi:hypothetical protein KGF56_000639 [Candida oxycetoniae]|uniref:C-CAP/cofactor C-like domain-containing protein n=1 Tax=Candida oxycetoniae TaxID=497107 RepID=A0AAI9T0R5_9ASCO|nr:uncharacterized protein KGF56_000639 [Candida oxycetoniae]KAI3406507.2 hypothetical protein KGF56_000639 [Candida oxycetoniae]